MGGANIKGWAATRVIMWLSGLLHIGDGGLPTHESHFVETFCFLSQRLKRARLGMASNHKERAGLTRF